MSRIWLISKHHFLQEARKRSFLILLFALPLFLAFTVGFGYLVSKINAESALVGYVDEPGIIQEILPPSNDQDVELVAFADEAAARSALDNEEIAAYFFIGSAYETSGRVTLVYHEPLFWGARTYFRDTLRQNLVAGQSPDVVERLMDGAQITVRALRSNREFPAGGPGAGLFMPLIVAVILIFLIMTTSSYLAEVVVAEKSNKTIELLITSVSAGKMMAGKIMGGVLIALLQLAVWLLCFVVAVLLGANVFEIGWLSSFTPIWRDVLLLALVGAPTYLLVAALMTLLGSMMSDTYDSSQISGLSIIVFFLPVYLLVPIIREPDGVLALILSLIPGTSVFTLAVRSLLFEVPAWQYIAASAIALLLALFVVWLAGKAFRLSMLRYGQRLRLKELFRWREAHAGPEVVIERGG